MPRSAGRIGWYLVWAVAFGSVGSSMYYVPGLLLKAAGGGAPALVGVLSIAFLGLVQKEAELTQRQPEGGGAIALVRQVLGEKAAGVLGYLLLIDLGLTMAISVLAGVEQLGARGVTAGALATGVLLGITAVNVVGVRGLVSTGFGVGVVALGLNAVVLGLGLSGGTNPEPVVLDAHSWAALGLGWLAFSGLEVCALLSPAMKEWGSTPTKALTALGLAVMATGPWLMWMTGGLPHEVLRASATHLLPELAVRTGGPVLGSLVAAAGAGLLFFAAHAAMTASYQVQLALMAVRGWPPECGGISPRFQTPSRALTIAGLTGVVALVAAGFELRSLGMAYAFAFTLAVGLGSLALDLARWRDGSRSVGWVFGAVVTASLLFAAPGVAWVAPMAAVGTAIALVAGLALRRAVQKGAWERWLARIPGVMAPSRVAHGAVPFFTLSELLAQGRRPGGVMVASRGADPRVLKEAAGRAQARGLTELYVIYVDEVPGLLYPQQARPSADGLAVLANACQAVRALGLTPLPIWGMSHSASSLVAEAVLVTGCDTLIIGATQRTVVWQALRGRFIQDLKLAVPTEVRITVVG